MGTKAPNATLLATHSLKILPAERYGEKLLGDLLDFLIEMMSKDEESFISFIELFEWLPKNVILSRFRTLLNKIQDVLRRPNPPKSAFTCISMIADSTSFNGKIEFFEITPTYLVLSYSYSASKDQSLRTSARKCLLSLCFYSTMIKTVHSIRNSIETPDGFLENISEPFIKEMDVKCIDSALSLIDDNVTEVLTSISILLCASIYYYKAPNKNIQIRLIPLITSQEQKVKVAALKAIQRFPPKV